MLEKVWSMKAETGSGTILAIALITASIGVFALTQSIIRTEIEHHRLNVRVEAIALAAADSLRGLATGYPCEVAGKMAQRLEISLDKCRVEAFEVEVESHKEVLGIRLFSKARAGASAL